MERITWHDRGHGLVGILHRRGPRGWVAVRRVLVPYAPIVQALRARDLARGELGELGGWFHHWWKHFKHKVHRFARHFGAKALRHAIRNIGRTWIRVEEKVRVVGLKIPVIKYFARLHGKYVAPLMHKLFFARHKHRHAKTPHQKRLAAQHVARLSIELAAAKQRVLHLVAAAAHSSPRAKLALAQRLRVVQGHYVVLGPNGHVYKFASSSLHPALLRGHA